MSNKILIWGPAPSINDRTCGCFLASRIYELKKQGYEPEVIQYGRVYIHDKMLRTKRKGLAGILPQIKQFFRFVYFKLKRYKNEKKLFESPAGSYYYYDSLDFPNWRTFYKWFTENRFEFIHAHFLWFAEPLPFLKEKFGIPYIITAHGSDIHETPFTNPEKVPVFADILNDADKAIFVSRFLLNTAKTFGYEDRNSAVIYNGYDPSVFYPPSDIQKKNAPLLGFVGHPIAVKRADILPDILYLVKKDLPDTRLLILGSEKNEKEDLLPEIKSKLAAGGLLESVDFIPEMPPERIGEYMRKIDILLIPSRQEGFGCVAIEAQACGKNVVGSDRGGIPESIGTGGFVVLESENFISDFAAAVIACWNDPVPQQKILERVKEFTWEHIVSQETALYKDTI